MVASLFQRHSSPNLNRSRSQSQLSSQSPSLSLSQSQSQFPPVVTLAPTQISPCLIRYISSSSFLFSPSGLVALDTRVASRTRRRVILSLSPALLLFGCSHPLATGFASRTPVTHLHLRPSSSLIDRSKSPISTSMNDTHRIPSIITTIIMTLLIQNI